MNDFWKGVIIWVIGAISVVILFNYLARALVYEDQYKAGIMTSCQSNGYTWGECYNVIHGDQSAFQK
jgi:hypothetical protein